MGLNPVSEMLEKRKKNITIGILIFVSTKTGYAENLIRRVGKI
jgi:hypothetical protein